MLVRLFQERTNNDVPVNYLLNWIIKRIRYKKLSCSKTGGEWLWFRLSPPFVGALWLAHVGPIFPAHEPPGLKNNKALPTLT